jgi:hypothetical protein
MLQVKLTRIFPPLTQFCPLGPNMMGLIRDGDEPHSRALFSMLSLISTLLQVLFSARCVEVQCINEQCPINTLLPNSLLPRCPLPNQHRHSLPIDLQASHPTGPISLNLRRMTRHLRTKREHPQNQVGGGEGTMMCRTQSEMRSRPISTRWAGCTREYSRMAPGRDIPSTSYQ